MNIKTAPNQKSARKSALHVSPQFEDDILDSLAREADLITKRASARGVTPAVVAHDPDLSVAPRRRGDYLPWSEAVQILVDERNVDFWGMLRVAGHNCFFGRYCIAHASNDRELYGLIVTWTEGYWWSLTHIQQRRAIAVKRKQQKN